MLLSASVALTVSTAVRTAVYSPVVTLYVDCEKAGVWGLRTTLMATVAMTDRLGVATSRASTVNYNTATTRAATGQQQHGRLQDNTGGYRATPQAATGQQHR